MAEEEEQLLQEITRMREGKKNPSVQKSQQQPEPPAAQNNIAEDAKSKPLPYTVQPRPSNPKKQITRPMNFNHQALFKQRLFLENVFWKHMKTNKDCFVLLEADKGYGKSTLGTVLGIRWVSMMRQYINYPMKFNLAKHIVYDDNVDHILEKINQLPNYSPLMFDEGGRIILGEDWNKKENKKIKKLFAEIRTKHLLVLVNSPFAINDIDRKYLQNFFDYWIHLWGPGFATTFMKNRHPLRKGFQRRKMDEILPGHVPDVGTMRELYYINNYAKAHPCYYDILLWNELSKAVYDQYQKMRDAAVYEQGEQNAQTDEEMSVNYKLRRDKFMLAKALREQGYTFKQLAKIQGRGTRAGMNQWYQRMEQDVIAREGSL